MDKKIYKQFTSYTTINNLLKENGYTPLRHSNININGVKHGFSGFFKNNENGGIIYINTDIECIGLVSGTILVRSAKNESDYSGGYNAFCSDNITLLKLAKERTQNFIGNNR